MLLFLPQNAEDREQKSSQWSSSLEMHWWFCVRYCLPLPSRPLYIQLENVGGGKGVGRIAVVYSIYLVRCYTLRCSRSEGQNGISYNMMKSDLCKDDKELLWIVNVTRVGISQLEFFLLWKSQGLSFPNISWLRDLSWKGGAWNITYFHVLCKDGG